MNERINDITAERLQYGQAGEGGESKREKYLVFSLINVEYGVPLSSVKEVIGLTEITPIPQVPDYFKGLINLRGKIISVVDLRSKLDLLSSNYDEKKTCIIITELDEMVLGVIVDDVNEVAGFMSSQIERGIDIQSGSSREFTTGVAKTDTKKLILLLDIGKVLSVEELKQLKERADLKAA